MKDLKHLIYFENLLQDAQNELVTKAVEDGQIALGYNCYYIPEVLSILKVASLQDFALPIVRPAILQTTT